MTYRLIIAGSRDFAAPKFLDGLRGAVDMFAGMFPDALNGDVEVFSGGCRGMDMHGEAIAAERGWKVRRFEPDWKLHGKKAGPLRNQAMMDAGADGAIVIYLDDSRGSADMVRRAEGEIDFLGIGMPRTHEGVTFHVESGEWR